MGSAQAGLVRVLVVEDEAAVAATMDGLLRHYGFEPRVAGTAADGLRQIIAWRPHAVLLDLTLPDGDALAVLRLIRRTSGVGVGVRVAVLGAAFDPRVARSLDALRPDRVFGKPLEFLEIRGWLNAVARGTT